MMMCGLFGDEPWWTLYMEHSPWNLTYLFSHQLMVCWCLPVCLTLSVWFIIIRMTRNCLWIHLETCVQIDVLYEYVCHSQWCYWFKLCNQGLLHWVLECFTFAAMSWTAEGYPRESRLSFHSKSCQWLRKSCTGTFMYFYTPSSHILTVVYCSLVAWRNRQLEAHVYRRLQAVYSCFQGSTFAFSMWFFSDFSVFCYIKGFLVTWVLKWCCIW